MKITVITLFPEMIKPFFNESIIGRAQKSGIVEIEIINLRDFGEGQHKTVDDRPYGGGAGMVLKADCLKDAIDSIKYQESSIKSKSKVVLTSAKGTVFNQSVAERLKGFDQLIIICGHYEGVDERVMNQVDEEISLGDFVMTGGEIATCAIVDSIVRLIPGVLKKEEATREESFGEVLVAELATLFPRDAKLTELIKRNVSHVTLLEHSHFTRPDEIDGERVPEELLTGNHKQIREWRLKNAYLKTLKNRPDLLD